MGYSPLGRKESDTTERLHFHFLSDPCAKRSGITPELVRYENSRSPSTY